MSYNVIGDGESTGRERRVARVHVERAIREAVYKDVKFDDKESRQVRRARKRREKTGKK